MADSFTVPVYVIKKSVRFFLKENITDKTGGQRK